MSQSVEQPLLKPVVKKARGWGAEEWNALGTILIAIGTFVTAGAAAFAIKYGYQQWTVDNAIDQHKIWTAPDMLDRQSRVSDALLCKFAPTFAEADHNIKDEDYIYMEGLLKAVSAEKSYRGLEEELVYFYQFFGGLNACVKSGRCDPVTSCQLFAADADNLNDLFRPTLYNLRKALKVSELGHEFKQFLEICVEKAPGTTEFENIAELVKKEKDDDELARKSEVWRKQHPREAADEAKPGWSAACERMRPDYRAGSASPAGEGG